MWDDEGMNAVYGREYQGAVGKKYATPGQLW